METIEKSRSYFGKLGAWASILLNLLLFVVKLILGFVSGSLALIADAVHTLSDTVSSLIVLVSFYITEKPSDKEHPFGHGRAEFISAIIMSTLLTITAVELLQSSVERILNPVSFTASWWIISVIFITVILKEGLAWYATGLSRKIRSDALLADAWHHRLDAISSLLVILAFIFSRYGYPYLDGPVGILISLIIIYSAYQIVKSPIDKLMGTRPDEELLDEIEQQTMGIPGVIGVHDVIIHNYGETFVISLHIEVDENLSFVEAHRIAEKVDKELRRSLDAHVTVHFDPVMERTLLYTRVESVVQEFCQKTPECESFHDLRIDGEENSLSVWLDLVPSQEIKRLSVKKLIQQCTNYVSKSFPGIKNISVKIEPKFSISRKSRHN
jgi:cation diffusion facilitator family transporter